MIPPLKRLEKLMLRSSPDRAEVETKTEAWPDEWKAIVKCLLDGETQVKTTGLCKCQLPVVRLVAEAIGWNPRWRLCGNNSPKIFGDQNLPHSFAKEKYLAGFTLQQIADVAGCSRERVRQVLFYQGVVPRRDVMTPRRQAAAVKNAAQALEQNKRLTEWREKSHAEHYAPWVGLWAAGVPMHEMANKLGLARVTIGVVITKLRKTHPEWFPYRKKGYADKLPACAQKKTA